MTPYSSLQESLVGNYTFLAMRYDTKFWTEDQIVQGQKVFVIGDTLSDEAAFMIVVELIRYAQEHPRSISEAAWAHLR